MSTHRFAVLGATGMLGSAVYLHLRGAPGVAVCGTCRRPHNVPYADELISYDPLKGDAVGGFVGRGDTVVNCIGLIKPYVENDLAVTIYVNSVYPHRLAAECRRVGARLIHITTDCVFSGRSGSYDEDAVHDAVDLYGRSKSLGEPRDCLVLRTSIIGREPHSGVSLVEWFLKQHGPEVNGFTNHWWNGVTTGEYARIVERVVTQELYVEGTRHVFSETLTKYEMLLKFREVFRRDTAVHAAEAPERSDRTLATKYPEFLRRLRIARFDEMVRDLLTPGGEVGAGRGAQSGKISPAVPAAE